MGAVSERFLLRGDIDLGSASVDAVLCDGIFSLLVGVACCGPWFEKEAICERIYCRFPFDPSQTVSVNMER